MHHIVTSSILHHGDVIRLRHLRTGKNLHSHQIPAPISKDMYEVSAYGNESIGDDKDHWKIVIDSDNLAGTARKSKIEILTTRIKLRHVALGCYLTWTKNKLPDWGFGQNEVVCSKNEDRYPSVYWNVEQHVNDVLQSEKMDSRSLSGDSLFLRRWKDFIDLNILMWNANQELVPKEGKNDVLTSNPSDWIILSKGIRMVNWNIDTVKFYLLGNPVLWYLVALSSATYLFDLTCFILKCAVDPCDEHSNERHKEKIYLMKGGILFIGYMLHYAPFFFQSRVLYLHHYFPALWMNILIAGVVAERKLSGGSKDKIMYFLLLIVIGTFLYFSPFSYGFVGSSESMKDRIWRTGWNI